MSSDLAAFDCQRAVANVGNVECPLYVGFASASTLKRISIAPAFDESAEHSDVSKSLGPGMAKWQRPLDQSRVKGIADAFVEADPDASLEEIELMPNPVLLALRDPAKAKVKKKNSSYEISILGTPPAKPLWILDGQHRIFGLAGSEQKENPIPFVLLMNEANMEPTYNTGLFAKIFAQITTKAEPIKKIHYEWLSFAFGINDYAPMANEANQRKKAMKATKFLCEKSWPGALTKDKISFNPGRDELKEPFAWPNNEWVDLFLKNYFLKRPGTDPEEVAHELHKALRAFREEMKQPEDSVLFGAYEGSDSPGRKPFQEGVVQAVLQWLAEDPAHLVDPNWKSKSVGLRLGSGDWTLGGAGGTGTAPSRKIVTNVFLAALSGDLPAGVSIPEWLRCGGSTFVKLKFFEVGAGGNKIGDPQVEEIALVDAGDPPVIKVRAEGRPRVDLELSRNLITPAFADRSMGVGVEVTKGTGFSITDLRGSGTKQLLVTGSGYGERTVRGFVDISV